MICDAKQTTRAQSREIRIAALVCCNLQQPIFGKKNFKGMGSVDVSCPGEMNTLDTVGWVASTAAMPECWLQVLDLP